MLTTRPLNPRSISEPNESRRGLEFLQCIVGVVDQSKPSGTSATRLCAETEDGDAVGRDPVEL